MKRTLSLLLTLLFLFYLSACDRNQECTPVDESTEKTAVPTEGTNDPPNNTQETTEDTTSKDKEQDEVISNTDVAVEEADGIIRFRGIRWYSTKSDVERFLFENGAKIAGWMSSDNDIYRMSGITYTNITMGKDRVDEGGYRGWYSGVSVAGYEASDTYACYIYPINADGSIETSEDDAQFYFGWYTFLKKDYIDITGIYDDLKEKICALYGAGQEEETDYHTTVTWNDAENNQIRLLRDDDSTYITLGYMAAGAEERLDEMQSALDRAAAQKEAEEREENKGNNSGL